MKDKLILIFLLFASTSSFGKKIYTMSREDFGNQFNEKQYLLSVYCHNEKGEKVWLYCNDNTILKISLKNNKTETLMLHTIKLKQGIIEAVRFNVWMPSKKVDNFDFKEVTTIAIEPKFQDYEGPYFNIDSCRIIAKQKNDSLRRTYTNRKEFVIYCMKSNKTKGDTLRLIENICYNLTFANGLKTEFGVVQNITKDSIYITNFFNIQMAVNKNKTFEVLGCLIKDIKEISLLKSGGYSYNNIKLENCILLVKNTIKNNNDCPVWFAINPMTGVINFYRFWQTDSGLSGITTEKDRKIVWYEGEETE